MTKAKKPNFEQQIKRLREVVQELEQGDLPLEKGVALYKEGVSLAASCREQLAKAKHEIAVLTEEGLQPLTSAGEDADSFEHVNIEDG